MKIVSKKMPMRKVGFSRCKLVGHRAIRADIYYTIDTRNCHTGVIQPIEFSMCDASHLARRFHEIANELEKQLEQFKKDLHGGE